MLSLISTDDRVELVISTDPAVDMPSEDRRPARAVLKENAKLNGGTPLILTIRPLDSLEAVDLMSGGEGDEPGTFKAIKEVVKTAIVRVDGEGWDLPCEKPTVKQISQIPFDALAAVGNYVVAQSIGSENPT